jgi:hypothetical protein
MLIRMTAGLSGPAYSLGPGDERDFPQEEAIRLIEAGYAVPAAHTQVEQVVKDPGPEQRDILVSANREPKRRGREKRY